MWLVAAILDGAATDQWRTKKLTNQSQWILFGSLIKLINLFLKSIKQLGKYEPCQIFNTIKKLLLIFYV